MEFDLFEHFKNANVSEQDFKKAIQSLVEKGLVQEIFMDGQLKYKLTSIGRTVAKHMDSSPTEKN